MEALAATTADGDLLADYPKTILRVSAALPLLRTRLPAPSAEEVALQSLGELLATADGGGQG